MVDLAMMYRRGLGVAADPAEAFRWYEEAAEKGDPIGMNGVGFSLREGLGVEKDIGAAVPWLQFAAEFGQPNAMHTLGTLYQRGEGVEQDPVKAYEWWLSLAATRYGSDEVAHREQAQEMALSSRTFLTKEEFEKADW